MSSTDVYAVQQNGDVIEIGSASNSHRGAMWIWNNLWLRYLQATYQKKQPWDGQSYGFLPTMDEDETNRLWALAKDERVSEGDRLALVSTFDNVIVKPEDIEAIADALESFQPPNENLALQASLIRQALADGCRGVCWNQTSVNESPWWYYDDDEGKYMPYNVDNSEKHWWLGEEKELCSP